MKKGRIFLVVGIIIIIVLVGLFFLFKKDKVIKAGDYTLKYGIYKSDLKEGELLGGTYEIKEDGTFEYKNTFISPENNEEKKLTATGKYEVYFSKEDGNKWLIKFNREEGYDAGSFSAFDIKDNDKFGTVQYHNDFTYQK